jgi:hypothetical protein
MQDYPERWADIYSRRLGAGIGWQRFQSCLADPASIAALREGLPRGLLSDVLAAAASPEPDRATKSHLARRLAEWCRTMRETRCAAGPTSDA